jgi:hypothetical protein
MARKTFEVETLKNIVNEVLATSSSEYGCTRDRRQGMMNLLEKVLHETGNYRGFRNLMLKDVPAGEKPGIMVNETGLIEHTPIEVRFDKATTDNTRVHYF